ncbi:DUF397 domain-containing protein [Streptomyces sp. ISL-99]|uniref:DUF397 domain-containing protein n=1 Tax=Streptomyces sp. ISL-99 TaxID=2819193 RepID=UPI001BE9B97D|nr:DUF397 domain-containing protein [Streptomyces sp. ISL-99]MBT2528204.1 DUF397 domain-containing protein [Streptomyces sp. ISL-99]
MSAVPEFEFAAAAACRDARVDNCPQVAMNVPGVVALRVVTMTADQWTTLTDAVKAGEFDLSA